MSTQAKKKSPSPIFKNIGRSKDIRKKSVTKGHGTNTFVTTGKTALSRDTINLKQIEEQLRVFSQAIDESPACILIMDRDGAIEYINKRFTTVTGYTLDDVRGRNLHYLESGETSDLVFKKMWEDVKKGEVWEGEILNRKKNGELYWAQILLAPVVDAGGAISRFVSMQHDITERKHLESELLVANTRLQFQLEEIERLHNQLREEMISTQKRLEALEALQKAGRTIISSLSLDETLSKIAEQALFAIGGGIKLEEFLSHIALLDNDKLRFVAAYPKEVLSYLQNEIEINLKTSPKLGIAGRVAKSKKPLVVSDISRDPDYIKLKDFTHSGLSVPLIVNEQLIGVLSIEHPELNAFTVEDVKNVEVFAAQAAIAIQNAQLYKSDVFVLMPFADQYQEYCQDVIKKTIEEMRLTCKRADDFFQSSVIMNDIMRCISEAGIIIADFSGRSPNVFFEVGIAHALGKNVILIAQDLHDVPPKLQIVRCHIYKSDLSGAKEFPEIIRKAIVETKGKVQPILPDVALIQQDPQLCHVLIPSGEKGKQTYNDLVLGVAKQYKFLCSQIGDVFDSESVLERMWQWIARANIVIADLTDRDPDVFYLAGLAYGLRKKIILISQNPGDVPFDLKKGSCLIYSLKTYSDGKSAKDKLSQILNGLLIN